MSDKKTLNVIYKIEDVSTVIILGIICFAVFAQVVSRFLLKTPLSWTEELSRYSLVWLTFVGASLALRHNGHFVIEVLEHKLHGRKREYLQMFILVLMLVYTVVLLINGLQLLPVAHMQESPALDIHMSYVYLAVPVGCVFMIVHLLVKLFGCYYNYKCNFQSDVTNIPV